jgi:hypothetical protein
MLHRPIDYWEMEGNVNQHCNSAKLSTGTHKEIFIALRNSMQIVKHLVVKDPNRHLVPGKDLIQMAEMYIVQLFKVLTSSIWLPKIFSTPSRRGRKWAL